MILLLQRQDYEMTRCVTCDALPPSARIQAGRKPGAVKTATNSRHCHPTACIMRAFILNCGHMERGAKWRRPLWASAN